MLRIKILSAAALFPAFFLSALPAADTAAPTFNDSILASVNGEAVTLTEVMRESAPGEQTALQVYTETELPAHVERLRKETVDRIINRKLLLQEFKRLKLELPQQLVENLLDELAVNFGCKTRSELARKARAAGTSIQELRDKAAERIMGDMVIGRELYGTPAPTPREMFEYFQARESEFSTPEEINLALLLLPPDTSAETVEELGKKLREAPENFSEAVKSFSAGPNRDGGGTVGFLEKNRLREEFLTALNALEAPEAGTVFGPVQTEEGLYFLRIAEVRPAVKAEFARIQPEIEKRMEQDNQKRTIEELYRRLREKAVIRYYFGPDAGKDPAMKPAPAEPKIVPAVPDETANRTQSTRPENVASPAKMEKKTMVTLKTNFGDIKLEMFPEAAPETVKNFLSYVKAGFYNGTLFHRVIDNFMIQGGGFDTKFRQKPTNAPVRNEADNRLSNTTGTIAMARTSDPHSATAQFFINVADNDFLDFRSPTPQFYGYCVFGKVVEGMDVVNKIKGVRTGGRGGHQDVPTEDVVILEAVAEE